MKTYRRFIRINGELHTSPRFNKKADAEKWYHDMRRKKQFLRDGLVLEEKDEALRFIDYARIWMQKRMVNYPEATWRADDQRLRDYILPFFSEIPISTITGPQIRTLLLKISEPEYLREGFTISASTRDRVKALLSAIFSDALNEDPPIVSFNPVAGIKIKEKRRGSKKPRHLSNDEALAFLKAAKELGKKEYIVASILLMAGLRKQELIALRWRSFNEADRCLVVSEKYEQVTHSIKVGTKAGEDSARVVPISSQLVSDLKKYRNETSYKGPDDFIVCRANGEFCGGRDISRITEAIRAKAKVDISPHGLRHTFGREFVLNTGNLKALQSILGHSSSSTTDIYSDLAGDRIKGFGEAVTFKKGVKRSGK